METIKMTARQRLNVESILRQKRITNENDFVLAVEVKRKLGFTEDERKEFLKDVGDGKAILNAVRLDAIEPKEIEFEMAELRALAGYLRETPFGVDDADWWLPFKEALKECKAW